MARMEIRRHKGPGHSGVVNSLPLLVAQSGFHQTIGEEVIHVGHLAAADFQVSS